jgi:hypothetical protein
MPDLFAVHLTANGLPVVVMLPAVNYLAAMAEALKRHPGGHVDSVRRLGRKAERAEQLELITE